MYGSKMGCALSSAHKLHKIEQEENQLKLNATNLTFNRQQLAKLNSKFCRMLDDNFKDPEREKSLSRLSAVVERLIQRLVCAVGLLDPRFSSKFLIKLREPSQAQRGLKYHYMIKLDGLSTPTIYPERVPSVKVHEGPETTPSGYAKFQLLGENIELYQDFINHSGFLRRDKIQERFLDLLALAAAQPGQPYSPLDVDESVHCGCPGKVVDPLTLYHSLLLPASQHIFFGAGETDEVRFPDPRDFRIAIVEGMPEIRIYISCLSSAVQSEDDIEVVLTLGIGVSDWPKAADFPERIALDHTDIILHYQVAQMGYFLVPCGPQFNTQGEDKTSLWQIRTPALEKAFESHYSPQSVISRCGLILTYVMNALRSRGVKILNRHLIKTVLNFELESRERLIHWSPYSLSRRILRILDTIVKGLREQNFRSYLFPNLNLLLLSTITEEDCLSDAEIIETYLQQLQERVNFEVDNEISVQDHLEHEMIKKWNMIIRSLKTPGGSRGRRLSLTTTSIRYSRRQMEYIAVLLREMLKLKAIQSKIEITNEKAFKSFSDEFRGELIFLIQLVCDHAKIKALSKPMTKNEKIAVKNLIEMYNVSVTLLIDGVKRMELSKENVKSDMHLVAKMIECLYSAIDSDPKIMKPILLPYLNQLFAGSHANCWFLQEWLQINDLSELTAIGTFNTLVLAGSQKVIETLDEAVEKGWQWAKKVLNTLKYIMDEHRTKVLLGGHPENTNPGLRVIFTPNYLQTVRFTISNSQKTAAAAFSDIKAKNTSNRVKAKRKKSCDSRYATIRSLTDTLCSEELPQTYTHTSRSFLLPSGKLPLHCILRDSTPLTEISEMMRRKGSNRGLGSIIQALVSLEKLTVIQEVSTYLPDHERTKVLSDVQKLSKEMQRLSINRRRNNALGRSKRQFSFRRSSKRNIENETNRSLTLPNLSKVEKQEIYRTINDQHDLQDVAGISTSVHDKSEEELLIKSGTLLGTCIRLRKHAIEILADDNSTSINNLPTKRIGGYVASVPDKRMNSNFLQ